MYKENIKDDFKKLIIEITNHVLNRSVYKDLTKTQTDIKRTSKDLSSELSTFKQNKIDLISGIDNIKKNTKKEAKILREQIDILNIDLIDKLDSLNNKIIKSDNENKISLHKLRKNQTFIIWNTIINTLILATVLYKLFL